MARRTLKSITDGIVNRANEALLSVNRALDDAAASAGAKVDKFISDAAETGLGKNAVGTGLAAMSQLTYRGSVGDFTSAEEMVVLKAKFTGLVGTNPTEYGSPLCRRRQISTLSGFVMCENPHMELSAGMISEATAIETFMTEGFFYE